MRARVGFVAVTAIAAALALVGCSGASGGSPSPSPSPVGAWGVEKTGQPSLTIADDGAFNGSDGCNTLVGHGTFSGSTFTFGVFVSTLMACPGVDTWLSNASTATVDGGKLVVLDKAGAKIGSLDKR